MPFLLLCQSSSRNKRPLKVDPDDCSVYKTITVKDVSFDMVFVRGGIFWMGAQKSNPNGQNYDSEAEPEEDTVHGVTLSDYYIGKTEVTQGLWYTVMEGSYKGQIGIPGGGHNGSGANYPAYMVSWKDIVGSSGASYKENGVDYFEDGFCYKLSVLANDGKSLGSRRYSLPTEAEWEYAARGGRKSSGYKYSGSNNLDDVAWYNDNSGQSPHEVGKKLANELGIYDMLGNVLEWCSDSYGGKYSSSAVTNPTGAKSGRSYMLRGGGWYHIEQCRVSYRQSENPNAQDNIKGFRVRFRP
jgi:formylglycine-generating enzyme required for sulfatase activity